MITTAILDALQSIASFLLGLLPNIPQMPDTIKDATNSIIDTIGSVVGVISYIYTPVIFLFVFGAILAILGFDAVYKLALWVYHKFRG